MTLVELIEATEISAASVFHTLGMISREKFVPVWFGMAYVMRRRKNWML